MLPLALKFVIIQGPAQLWVLVYKALHSCVYLYTRPCTAVGTCIQGPAQLWVLVYKALHSCVYLYTRPCTAVCVNIICELYLARASLPLFTSCCNTSLYSLCCRFLLKYITKNKLEHI